MNQSESKPERLPATSALKPILFSTLILISGIAIGAGLTLIITGDSDTPKSLPPGPEYMSVRMVERIVRELKLSPQQHEQLRPIVQKHTKAMEDIRQEARPKISSEIKEMNEEIIAILDERQKKIWQDKIQRMQEHFTRMRHRRSPDDGRRSGRDSNSQPRRGERRPDNRFPERPPEGQLPPEKKPPIDDMTPPERVPPSEMPPADNIN